MKKVSLALIFSALCVFVMAGQTFAVSSVLVVDQPAILYEEGFEVSDDLSTYDHLYTAHANEITSDGALSGNQSLSTFVVDAPGQWVDTLSIKKDFTQIKGANAFEVRGMVKTSNYQQLMVEVRKNYDGNTVDNMPYEFIVQFDETAKTISRPCWAGWYNACTTLKLYNEEYDISNQGVITFKFEFSSNEPVIITFRGVIKNLAEVAVMTFDDIKVAEKPLATENFEYIKGNFWEDTAFWANAGGIETDPLKVISGSKSLRYDIQGWTLGGITNSKMVPPKEKLLRLSFDVRSINGKQFLLATPWSPLYFEYSYNFETNQLSHPGLSVASATMNNGILHAVMEFTIPASNDLQSFNFYGDLLNTSLPGSFIIDNFSLEVLEKQPMMIPVYQVGYAITKSPHMTYRTNIKANEWQNLKDSEGVIIDPSHYTVNDYLFSFDLEYLDGFEASMGNTFTVETTFGIKTLSLDIYDIRPSVTPANIVYNKALMQNVNVSVDLIDETLVDIKLNDADITDVTVVDDTVTFTLTYAMLQGLVAGEYDLVVRSTGGTTYVPFNVVDGDAPFEASSYQYTKGSTANLVIPHHIDKDIIDGVYAGQTLLVEGTQYQLTETTLTLLSTYLNTLNADEYTISVKTKTAGISFDLIVNIPAVAPTTGDTSLNYDIYSDTDFVVAIDLHSFVLTSITFNGTALTEYTYTGGILTINESVFESITLGNKNLVVTTQGGTLTIVITVTNSAPLNAVIDLDLVQASVEIQVGASFDEMSNITMSGQVGQTTIQKSLHLDKDTPGRYVVTIVVQDTQQNISMVSYVVEVLGSEYSVTITFGSTETRGGIIDEAIIIRRSMFDYNC